MGCLADSFPSFTLFRLYHRWSTAWMGLGRASPSYCCHFGVFGSWWVPPCGRVWGDLVWWSYPHHLCIGSLHGYPVTSSHPAGAELSSYDGGTAVPPQHEPSGLGSVSVTGLRAGPQKLVDKVRSGAYVDMKELLGDNISLLSQLESLNIAQTLPALPGSMKPRLREVSSLASWLYCFLAYAALRCPDKESRDRLVYPRLVIREAQRHGGQRWLAYDRVFRQQAALDPSFQWNVLHPAI